MQAKGLVEDLRRELLEKQSDMHHLQLADSQGRKRAEEVERSANVTQKHLGSAGTDNNLLHLIKDFPLKTEFYLLLFVP